MDCYWFITAPVGERVTLKIKFMDIERHRECSYDYVMPFDGEGNQMRYGLKCPFSSRNEPDVKLPVSTF